MYEDILSVVFSDLLEHTSDVFSKFNPSGEQFAAVNQCQLLVWDILSGSLIRKFISDYQIDSIQWSPDSELICCCMNKNTIIQIWNVLIPEWKWKLFDSSLPFVDVFWAPDSHHLLVISEFYVKIKVWSLVSQTSATLENTKPIKDCTSFSTCGKYLAVAERISYEDYVTIYASDIWCTIKSFSVETKDAAGIYFSPSALVISVLEASAEEYKVLFYTVDGRLLAKYTKESNFGVSSISWSPNGKFVAIGSYSGEITVLQSSNYKEITCYDHPESVNSKNIVVYRVLERSPELDFQIPVPAFSNCQQYKVEQERPLILSSILSSTDKSKLKSIKLGIQNIQYSADGQYIATALGQQPNVLCIFDSNKFKLSTIIIHSYKIKSIAWHSKKPILAICTGSANLDVWTPSSCICFLTPFKDELPIIMADWCKDKDRLIINGKDKFMVLSLQ